MKEMTNYLLTFSNTQYYYPGIHLTSGGPVWNYDKRNPPKGTWLTAPVWLETAADVYDALDYIEENESEDDSEDDSE